MRFLGQIQNKDEEIVQLDIAKEYGEFAYIVSHDLKAPLRHIKEFTKLLISKRKDNLSEEEQTYVEYLEKSLTKVDEMLAALLSFSRLNTRAGEMRETNLNALMAAVLEDLKQKIETHSPKFHCDDLPILKVEPGQIKLLFYNLIENALKFNQKDIGQRVVDVFVSDHGKKWMFEIKDNGIGIGTHNQDEVFNLFKRLEPEKYNGLGTGLTLARKIVQRHGGEIFLESQLEKGTSVFFSLPK